jgi:hypothetical protein
MIRKTKHIKRLIRNNHGHLEPASEFVTLDDIFYKLHKYEDMEQKEKVNDIMIRVMVPEDYDQVYRLWCGIKGFGIRSMDDSKYL